MTLRYAYHFSITALCAGLLLGQSHKLTAQCFGGLGTITLPPPTNGNQIWTDIDVDGNGSNDMRIRRLRITASDELIDVYSLGNGQNCNIDLGSEQAAGVFPRPTYGSCTTVVEIYRISNGVTKQ